MNEQTIPSSPPTESQDRVVTKPRERGLERVDVRPVLRRLKRMVGQLWTVVLGKIDRLNGMRFNAIRAAYLRCVGENVATSEDVLPDADFYVDASGRLAERSRNANAAASKPVVISAETEAFLDGRAVRRLGAVLIWFVRTGRTYRAANGIDPKTGEPAFQDVDRLRQDRPLNRKEASFFKDLPEEEQLAILAMASAHSSAPAN